MSAIETIALIFAVLTLVKITVILIKPAAWMKVTDPIYHHPAVSTLVYLALSAIVGYYLLQHFTVVEIAAVMMFTMLLIGIGFLPYSGTLFKLRSEVMERGLGRMWLPLLIWVALALWVLFRVF